MELRKEDEYEDEEFLQQKDQRIQMGQEKRQQQDFMQKQIQTTRPKDYENLQSPTKEKRGWLTMQWPLKRINKTSNTSSKSETAWYLSWMRMAGKNFGTAKGKTSQNSPEFDSRKGKGKKHTEKNLEQQDNHKDELENYFDENDLHKEGESKEYGEESEYTDEYVDETEDDNHFNNDPREIAYNRVNFINQERNSVFDGGGVMQSFAKTDDFYRYNFGINSFRDSTVSSSSAKSNNNITAETKISNRGKST
ncbi:hypothetical protein G9A89_011836 [Geosiphon pyriformis]|nr:hypothetical protein G9A89_011836 [Geosiphon pyriformis]